MNGQHIVTIVKELSLKVKQVEATAQLLEEGGTVPFIARYRKEVTGSLDEVAITAIRDRLDQLAELDKRRDAILESISTQGKLTDQLKEKIEAAGAMSLLEDLYLPYKPKRRTRASIAKDKGLEPLAAIIFEQGSTAPGAEAEKYIDKEKGVEDISGALAGARDIIAEWISEDQGAREKMRRLYWERGEFVCKVATGKEDEAIKYKDYFDWTEPVAAAPSHRVLAMRRGAREKMLTLRAVVDEAAAVELIESLFVKSDSETATEVKLAVADGFKRLLSLSMETEVRLETKKRADQEAIKVFAENLRQLLLSSPLGQKSVLALDPGFRTGCKLVCLDGQGKLLYHDAIYPHSGGRGAVEAAEKVQKLCDQYKIEAIAIGNGTAGRETEEFVRKLSLGSDVAVVMVNESGASIYSASEAGREEFGDYDLTVRGAVSIGRRLMDPLAELVKIDPKSIGVGQYQHDVDQALLKNSLDDTVMSCVNNVGVEVNTASKQLLTYVSGMGPRLAGQVVKYRDENGPFADREELKKVSGLGAKTFEQCAGFLRIRGGANPLDRSAVHPESYGIIDAMSGDLSCSVSDFIGDSGMRNKIDLQKYVTETVGMPTLNDIVSELGKPGRDPRKEFEIFQFAAGVNEMKDLAVGMELPGIVTNITAFGAFVDVGVHQDGLVHISEMANRYIKDPAEIVKVNQKVKVKVTAIDIDRKRIALSMKGDGPDAAKRSKPQKNKKPVGNSNQGQRRQQSNQAFGNSLNITLGSKSK